MGVRVSTPIRPNLTLSHCHRYHNRIESVCVMERLYFVCHILCLHSIFMCYDYVRLTCYERENTCTKIQKIPYPIVNSTMK